MGGLKRITVHAPAKINLSLEILGRRSDGFHELETVFQAIDLDDTLTVELRDDQLITLRCDDPAIPADPSNLVWKAALAWREAHGSAVGIALNLAKRIPHGAGLGGGSSDAAATLLALNALVDDPLPHPYLRTIALALGSDVPFFLVGGTAHATGRGEVLTALPDLPPLPVTVLMPDATQPTPAVFKELTDAERGPRAAVGADAWRARLAGVQSAEDLRPLLANRLAAPARRLCPPADRLLAWLESLGVPHLLSGSGAACLAFVAAQELPSPPDGVRALPTAFSRRRSIDVDGKFAIPRR